MQGVSYRASARDEALRLGLKGWVRNLPGGDVEALAEGEDASIDAFLGWCRMGPPEAHVERVAVTPVEPAGELDGFQVRR